MQVHEIENAPRENISHCENEWMANQFAILHTYVSAFLIRILLSSSKSNCLNDLLIIFPLKISTFDIDKIC